MKEEPMEPSNQENQPDSHEGMWAVCRKLPSDFEPYGERVRKEGSDCSGGCRFFVPLYGDLAFDWGVCANPKSPRAGLLTFEHQGCPEFEGERPARTRVPEAVGKPSASLPESDEESPPQRLSIDWGHLQLASEMSSDPEADAYLNKRTGEVVIVSPYGDDEEELRERIEEEWEDWIAVERIDSHTAYKIMENFASSRKKGHVRKLLSDALSGPRPFRRFKDVVHGNEDLRQEWFAFEEAAQKEAIDDWLASHGVQAEWK